MLLEGGKALPLAENDTDVLEASLTSIQTLSVPRIYLRVTNYHRLGTTAEDCTARLGMAIKFPCQQP